MLEEINGDISDNEVHMENTDNMNTQKQLNGQEKQSNDKQKNVSIKIVAIIYFGGLLIAMFVTWAIGGFEHELFQFAHFFPLGCMVFAHLPDPCLYFGYVVYAIIYVLAFLFRQKEAFIALLVIYIFILCLSIGGCSMMMNIHIS